MMNERQLFQKYLAPTSLEPMGLQIEKAESSLLFDNHQKPYIDLIGGVSVCNVGHRHPKVIHSIQQQLEKYLHIMVYGELVQSPQVQYAELLCKHLPEHLNCVYFTNSGAEAVEGAMKLAKRFTNRAEIIACHHSYHGSTQGPLSLLGDETYRRAFRPLLPGIKHVWHNDFESLKSITEKTACIILEPIQAEAGVKVPSIEWMQALRKRCTETGCLLIFDEIQTGFGRTGKLWAFEHFGIEPDVLLLAKALGGGMPLGAFISSKEILNSFAANPILGHITTFGGHPVSCAAGKAALEAIIEEDMLKDIAKKEALFLKYLKHPLIKAVRHKGLFMAVELPNFETVIKIIEYGLQRAEKGIFTDWFLFAIDCIRIVPPLIITEEEVIEACQIILEALNNVEQEGNTQG